jgi:hypothetical protein
MWQMEQGERQVSGSFKKGSLAKGRKTPTEKPRVERLFRHGEAPPREYTLTENHWSP